MGLHRRLFVIDFSVLRPYKFDEVINKDDITKSHLLCPEDGCGLPSLPVCLNFMGAGKTFTCENGHSWFLSPDGTIIHPPPWAQP